MRLAFDKKGKDPVWIMKKDDEDFYRLFVKAYVNAKLEMSKDFIVDFIKRFKAKENLTDDIYTSYYHLFFWRKTPIELSEIQGILRFVKEMRKISEKKYHLADEDDKTVWGRLMLGLENYENILVEGIKKKEKIFPVA